MGNIRIIQLPESNGVSSGDYIATDNENNGTKKVEFTNLLDTDLANANKAAQAKATGDALNAEISARTSADTTLNSRVDSLIANQTNESVTTLWTGSLVTVNSPITLSSSVANYDFIDVYYGGVDSKFTRIPRSNGGAEIHVENLSDNATVKFLQVGEIHVSFSGTSFSITKGVFWEWLGNFTNPPTVRTNNVLENGITRINGIKIGHIDNDEVVDARIGADGITYPNLGTAIRTQVSDLKADLTTFTGNASIPITQKNKYIDLSGSSVTMSGGVPQPSGSSTTYSYSCISCQSGDQFLVSGTGGAQTRLWGFVSSSGEILDKSARDETATDLLLTAPDNSAFIIIHGKTTSWETSYKNELLIDKYNSLKNNVGALSEYVDEINDRTWTLESDIEKDTATGQIVNIKYGLPSSCISFDADIIAKQSGTGVPTPTNIRPITPVSAVDIYSSNKNIFTGTVANLAYDSGIIKSSSSYRCIYQRVIGGKTYTVSRKTIDTNRFRITTTANEPVAGEPIGSTVVADSDYSATISVPLGHNYIFVYLSNQSSSINVSNYQIEFGDNATNFASHQGKEIELTFPVSCYSGKLISDSFGNWKVIHNKIAMVYDGTESWEKDTESGNTNGSVFYLVKKLPFETFSNVSDWGNLDTYSNWLDKSDTAVSSTSKTNSYWWNTDATRFRVVYGSDTTITVDAFKSFLSENNLVIVGVPNTTVEDSLGNDKLIAYPDSTVMFTSLESFSASFVLNVNAKIDDAYDVSNSNLLGNITIRAAKTVNFNDGTQPIIEWYLLQDIDNNFYMSKDLRSKKYLFTFDPPTSYTANWSFGIDADNNIYCILQASALASSPRLDDNNRIVNPYVWLNSDGYAIMHEIDFGNSLKPVGWLGNYGWCVLPNKDIILCEYTRPNVGTCNVWHIDGSNPTDANSWEAVWSHAIVETEDSDLGMKHCHCVQYDFFADVCYFGTGDSDVGSYVYHSTDNGETWELTYGPNKKKCRMLTFVFTEDYVYWASDSYDAQNHYFFIAERNNGIIDIENATEIALGAVNHQACYGCVYLQDLNIIVMMDRNDTTNPDGWTFILSGYDLNTNEVVTLGYIKPLEMNAGFRTLFIDWYPIDNHINIGFNPTRSSTGVDINENGVCGNLAGISGNGSTRINNLIMSVYKKASGYSLRFDTRYI